MSLLDLASAGRYSLTDFMFPAKGGAAGEADPSGKKPSDPGAKLDAGKNRVWLMLEGFAPALDYIYGRPDSDPIKVAVDTLAAAPYALEEVARVTTAGAAKYTPGGWAQVENGFERYLDAYGRHVISLAKGEEIDDGEGGTGCLHQAQQIWNLLAALTLGLRAELPSERLVPVGELAAELITELDVLLAPNSEDYTL